MRKSVQVGDKFKLGIWIWKVDGVYAPDCAEDFGWFKSFVEGKEHDYRELDLEMRDAEDLEWIEEIKPFTKEQARNIKDKLQELLTSEFYTWLDEYTEK